nr:uncharacterized protein LOC111510844 [Leptinotarsa decemlineata]
MPNVRGMRSQKRAVLSGVAQSVVVYGAPVWHEVLRIERHRSTLMKLQRRMLLRVASAYRTAATEGLCIITGTIPIDLLIKERVAVFERLGEAGFAVVARQRTVEEWQRRWNAHTTTTQWTKTLIPDLHS